MKSVRKSKKKCFVIMPFNRFYERRYERIYEPAIEAAGLFPHLAGGAGVSTITEDIEKGIRNSHICFADISEDNPNVWYELGFAYACGKQVVMVCDRKKRPGKLPFDVSVKNVNFHPAVQSVANRKIFQQDIIDDLMEKAAVAPINVAAPIVGGGAVASSQSQGGVRVRLPKGWEPMDRIVFKEILNWYAKHRSPKREVDFFGQKGLLSIGNNPIRVQNSIMKLMGEGLITVRVIPAFQAYDACNGYMPTYEGEKFARKNPSLSD